MSEATQISEVPDGSRSRGDEMLPLVYDELRRLAAYRLAHERAGQTLQATALVHEAYLRLAHAGCDRWDDAHHFFNAVADAMRRILIDNARRKRSAKHGGNMARANLDDCDLPAAAPPEELLALDDALEQLTRTHPDEAQLVKLRYFVGMTEEEAARILGISRAKASNWWAFARAWLYEAMHPEEVGPPPSRKKSCTNDL